MQKGQFYQVDTSETSLVPLLRRGNYKFLLILSFLDVFAIITLQQYI